jgi:hypothetical protein
MQGLLLVIRVANITENPSPVRGVFNGKYPTGGGVSADVIWGGGGILRGREKRNVKEKGEKSARQKKKAIATGQK